MVTSVMKKAVTLIELTMVVIVIGILTTIAYPIYSTTKERALDKEAVANLKLIQAAEKIYRMETGGYYPLYSNSTTTTDIGTINQWLKLDIPQGTSKSWNYTVTNSTGANTTRIGASRSWNLTYTSNEEPGCVNGTGAGVKCPY